MLFVMWIPSLCSFSISSRPVVLLRSSGVTTARDARHIFSKTTIVPPSLVQANTRRRTAVRMSLSADDRKALWDEIAKLELDLEEAVQVCIAVPSKAWGQ
eukprot:1804868-Rhodomonas_salina.1